ncbi:hypothetical protein QCA50_003330 [Cerrena zonata]|uniref:DUF6534 domain-containing protein n=1 Tax=Cerrena zonata TaxID=2478898 RepID=A0AAW0GK76_9APHY
MLMTNLQAYVYFLRNPEDSWALKTTIAVLLLLDNVQLVLVTYAYYNLTITHFSDLAVLLLQPQWLPLMFWFEECTSIGYGPVSCHAMTKSKFCFSTVLIVSRRKYELPVALALMSIATFGCGIMFAVKFAKIRGLGDISSISWPVYLNLGTIALCDVSIAAVLCVLLRRQATLSRSTYSIFRSLILYGINASALTSICAVTSLILYATMRNSIVCIAFYCMLPKLYYISLLALLNSRKSLRERRLEAEMIVISQIPNSSYVRNRAAFDHTITPNQDKYGCDNSTIS